MFEMLITLDEVKCVESNSQAKGTRCLPNEIERGLALGAVGHNLVGEAIFTLNEEIPLANLEA